MPLGLVYISLQATATDEPPNATLNMLYPEDFSISKGLIQKIVSYCSGTEAVQEGISEFKYGDKIILVAITRVQNPPEIDLIFIILSAEEVGRTSEYSELLAEHIQPFYRKSKQSRIEHFTEFAKVFFKRYSSKKLLFIGFPAAGKTCIKKAFFDGVDPQMLLGNNAPEPTQGLAHFVYSWLDAEVGIIDSAGQEFDMYVSTDTPFERMTAFASADVIVYVFDINNWIEEQEKVSKNLEKIVSAKNELANGATIYAFCHKIDLLTGTSQEKSKVFLGIREILETQYGIKVIFTSIRPEYIHTLFRSMQILLNDLSKMGSTIEEFCQEVLEHKEKSAILLLNEKNAVISQKSTPDIKQEDIIPILSLIKNQLEILRQTPEFGELDYAVVHTKMNMAIIIKSVSILKYGVSTVAFLGHSLSNKTLNELLNKMDQRLNFESRTTNIAGEAPTSTL